MKLSTFALGFLSAFTFVNSQLAAPTYVEYEANIVERDLNLPSLVAELLDGFDVADIISNIDFERIAGWADDLLNTGDNIKILDNILVGLKNTKILPEAAVYIVTHNSTLNILKESLPTVLKVAGQVNSTSLFVALDRSGLAYSVVAGALSDDEFLPSVLEIAKKLIESGGISLSSLLDQAEQLVQRDILYDNFDSGVESFPLIEKRDNIEDLLTTVFGSVERSGLINDTVITLLTDDEFQDATVVLIQGLLQNIGSIIKGTDFTALKPILNSLLESGLLTHTLERALQDEDLREALTSDLATLLKQGSIKKSDLVDKSKEQSILAMDSLMESTSSGSGSSDLAAATSTEDLSTRSSSTKASSTSTSTTTSNTGSSSSESTDIAASFGATKMSIFAGLLLALI